MTRQKNLEDDTTDVSVWSPHSVVPVRLGKSCPDPPALRRLAY